MEEDRRYTVPWLPGMIGTEFDGVQIRELFDAADRNRGTGLLGIKAFRALGLPDGDPDKREGMLVGCCLEMGMLP